MFYHAARGDMLPMIGMQINLFYVGHQNIYHARHQNIYLLIQKFGEQNTVTYLRVDSMVKKNEKRTLRPRKKTVLHMLECISTQ